MAVLNAGILRSLLKWLRNFLEKYDIVIFGGLGEVDIANDIEKSLIEKGVTNYQNLAGKTTISELINQISSLDLFMETLETVGYIWPMQWIAAAFQRAPLILQWLYY